MFTSAEQCGGVETFSKPEKVGISSRVYTLHKRHTFFKANEIAILRHAVAICPLHTIVFHADFLHIASGTPIRKIIQRMCVLGFFTRLPPTTVGITDPIERAKLKKSLRYKISKPRIADLLEKIDSINEMGITSQDRTMLLAAAKLKDWPNPITTQDLVFFTTLSGTPLVQWLNGNKDLVQRIEADIPFRPYHHFFTKKMYNVVRTWQAIHAMVAAHSKMK